MIESLKELEKLLKLCRKQGVSKIEFNNVKLELGELPIELVPRGTELSDAPDPYKDFPQGELTPDQLMFYSAGGRPEDDPALKDQSEAS